MVAKLLRFAAIVELGTGVAVILVPQLVVGLLLGGELAGAGIPVARCFGVALLGLGLACWPREGSGASAAPAFRGMLTYNALIALYLAYLFSAEHQGGALLWPAVALHAAVAILLVWAWRAERSTIA